MSAKKKTRISRRKFLGSAAGAALVVGTSPAGYLSPVIQAAPQNPAQAITPDTTLALVNGRFHTMNAANAIVNAVTIRNGRIVTAGNTAPAAGANTRTVDPRPDCRARPDRGAYSQ